MIWSDQLIFHNEIVQIYIQQRIPQKMKIDSKETISTLINKKTPLQAGAYISYVECNV